MADYTFSLAAGLFFVLEELRFPRRERDGAKWVLNERALIVRVDCVAFQKASMFGRPGLCGIVKTDLDLEDGALEGFWQYVDCRSV